MITQSNLKDILMYNRLSGEFFWSAKASHPRAGMLAGCVNGCGYSQIKIKGVTYYAHRLAWLYVYGEFPENQIDHINHIRSDNRWCNLREVTHQENSMNRNLDIDNTSGVIGVSWSKRDNKWYSRIKINSKEKYIGLFEDKFEAICARKSANNKYGFHSNHGNVNF